MDGPWGRTDGRTDMIKPIIVFGKLFFLAGIQTSKCKLGKMCTAESSSEILLSAANVKLQVKYDKSRYSLF
jgi:hypothetical protein